MSVVAVEVFDAGAGVENDDPFSDVDLAGCTKFFERGKACGAFRSDEKTFLRSNFARDVDHFLIVDRNGTAVGLAKNPEHKKVTDRFRNAQTGGDRVRVRKFGCSLFAGIKCTNDWRATARLNRKHARTFVVNPT